MDKGQAAHLISNTFENSFDENQYLHFLRELFNGEIDESTERKFDRYGQFIPDSFKESIKRYKRLGIYTDPNGHRIDLLVVTLKDKRSLDHARTMQRNFAAYHLKKPRDKELETAIIAYTSEPRDEWRFSMVRRESVVTLSESGKLTAKEDLTPVRRYSFIVGHNHGSHTAQTQLLPILVDDKNDPTLQSLEDAFNIETVTKEFFNRYKELFLSLKEELDRLSTQNLLVQTEFEKKGLETANFAKKLLGQIVFLYFLQKKGWLGVQDGKAWGSGPKNFLRQLFDRDGVTFNNYFNDILEPLFYEALAVERPENLYKRLNVKIPFLNGGLFEPVNNYDWRGVDILIKNDVFAEIFKTFDLYNFTVREDEPLEKEVAVDPEMLGKVFENLLEVKDRKSKGAFYTPREIVHYMCQESLIHYLDTQVNLRTRPLLEGNKPQKQLFELPPEKGDQLGLTEMIHENTISREDIATFIHFGEQAVQNDTAKGTGTVSYKYQMPMSIRAHAQILDTALANIKICDPAIGSGAFPVGMMQEIVKAREVLTTYLNNKEGRTTYHFKRHAIQESIYGVDIDSSAIDIAKLRLWLSLVVDEEDYRHIKPLPNLDYKIVCGNSLSSIKRDMFNDELFKKIEHLKTTYFNETNILNKQRLRTEINTLIARLTGNYSRFDMQIYFSEVFHRGGFDVVIANPPYVDSEEMTRISKDLRQEYQRSFKTAKGNWDLFVIFIEEGFTILRSNGVISYIVPNKFVSAPYSEALRTMLNKHRIYELRDFSNVKVFKEADVYPVVFVIQKSSIQQPIQMTVMKSEIEPRISITIQPRTFHRDIYWDRYFLDNPIKVEMLEKLMQFPQLSEYADVFGAATVSEAYEIKKYIEEGKKIPIDYKKLINTGTIDPYISLFGIKPTQYIKKSYIAPIISDTNISKISKKRLEQAKRPKIIIGGMTKKLECFLDVKGQYLAGKSTTIVLQRRISLYYLIGILNSQLASFFYRTFFKSLSLAGGYLRIGAPQVEMIPIAYKEENSDVISSMVTHLLDILSQDTEVHEEVKLKAETILLDIDEVIYDLYGLSEKEKSIIKQLEY